MSTSFAWPQQFQYRQIVLKKGEGEHKLVRAGENGHEYAQVKLSIEPSGGGGGFEFYDEALRADSITKRFLSAIETGALRAAETGLWGFSVTDFRVQVMDGSYHETDSTNAAFEEAARLAMVQAMENADPALFEPWITLMLRFPEKYLETLSEIKEQRAVMEKKAGSGDRTVLVYGVPQSEANEFLEVFATRTEGCGMASVTPRSALRALPEALTQRVLCSGCKREMLIPVVGGKPYTETCLICGKRLAAADSDNGAAVLKQ